MQIAPFEIDLVRQEPKSDDCLRACGKMIFSFYQERITKKEIWQKLHVYKKHSGLSGGYLTDLGKFALKKGYKSTILHYDWHWWNKDTVDACKKGKKALLSALRKLKKEKRAWPEKKEVEKEISFLESGGKFLFEKPSYESLDSFLFKKTPLILNVRTEDLYQSPNERNAHFVLLSGRQGDFYFIKDPYLAVEKVNSCDLMIAWIRTGAWMMAILPKEKKSRVSQTELNF